LGGKVADKLLQWGRAAVVAGGANAGDARVDEGG
jgi:hypothetical protein